MKRLTDDVRWINPCHPVDGEFGHLHVGAFLVGDGPYVLIDTGGTVHHERVRNAVEEVAGRDSVAAIVLTHSDLPHGGNLRRFMSRWPNASVFAATTTPEFVDLPPETRPVDVGSSSTIAGREFAFVDPPLADRSFTTWIQDADSGILFISDGFGSHHPPGVCDETAATFDPPREAVRAYVADALPWVEYADPPLLRSALDDLLSRTAPTWIAPAHGPPVPADRLDDLLDTTMAVVADFAAPSVTDPTRTPDS